MKDIAKNVFHFTLMILLSYVVYTIMYILFDFLFAIIYDANFVICIILLGMLWLYADVFIFKKILECRKWNVSKKVYISSQVLIIPYFAYIKLYSWLDYKAKFGTANVSLEFQNKTLIVEMIFTLISILVVWLMCDLIYEKDEKNIE